VIHHRTGNINARTADFLPQYPTSRAAGKRALAARIKNRLRMINDMLSKKAGEPCA